MPFPNFRSPGGCGTLPRSFALRGAPAGARVGESARAGFSLPPFSRCAGAETRRAQLGLRESSASSLADRPAQQRDPSLNATRLPLLSRRPSEGATLRSTRRSAPHDRASPPRHRPCVPLAHRRSPLGGLSRRIFVSSVPQIPSQGGLEGRMARRASTGWRREALPRRPTRIPPAEAGRTERGPEPADPQQIQREPQSGGLLGRDAVPTQSPGVAGKRGHVRHRSDVPR